MTTKNFQKTQLIDFTINTDNLSGTLGKLERGIIDNNNAINEFKQNFEKVNSIKDQVSESLLKIEATEGRFLIAFSSLDSYSDKLRDLEKSLEDNRKDIQKQALAADERHSLLEEKIYKLNKSNDNYMTKDEVDILISSALEDFKIKFKLNELYDKLSKNSEVNKNQNKKKTSINKETIIVDGDLKNNNNLSSLLNENVINIGENRVENDTIDNNKSNVNIIIDKRSSYEEVGEDSYYNNTKNDQVNKKIKEATDDVLNTVNRTLRELTNSIKIVEEKVNLESDLFKHNLEFLNQFSKNIEEEIKHLGKFRQDDGKSEDSHLMSSDIHNNSHDLRNNCIDFVDENSELKKLRQSKTLDNYISSNIENEENDNNNDTRKDGGVKEKNSSVQIDNEKDKSKKNVKIKKSSNNKDQEKDLLANEQNKKQMSNINTLIRQLEYRINELRFDLTENDKKIEKLAKNSKNDDKNKDQSISSKTNKFNKLSNKQNDTSNNKSLDNDFTLDDGNQNKQNQVFNEMDLYNKLYNKLMFDLYQKLKGNQNLNSLFGDKDTKKSGENSTPTEQGHHGFNIESTTSANKKLRSDVENLGIIVSNLTVGNRNLEEITNRLQENFILLQDSTAKQLDAKESIFVRKIMDATVNENRIVFAEISEQIRHKMDDLYKKLDTNILNFEAFKNETKGSILAYDELMNILKGIQISSSETDIKNSSRTENDKSVNYDKKNGFTVKDFLKKLIVSFKMISDNLDKVSKKQESMLNVITDRLKNNLKEENQSLTKMMKDEIKKLVDKFSSELNTKAEIKLIEKLANQIEDKFDQEISKKLDKNEIKKNNNVLNRKVSI